MPVIYKEYDHPIIRGIIEMFRTSNLLSSSVFILLYLAVIGSIVAYYIVRRHRMNRKRWIYIISSFVVITGLFLASILIPGNIKRGYYEGDVKANKIVPITQNSHQYGIITKDKIKPNQIKGLIVNKSTLKKHHIKEGDMIRIKTDSRYKPTKTTSYVSLESSDVKKIDKK